MGFLAALSAATASASPPTIEVAGEPRLTSAGFVIRAHIKAASGVYDPRLNWRYAGETPYRAEAMAGDEADNFSAVLPADTTSHDVEYFVSAFDKTSLDEADWKSKAAPAHLAAGGAGAASANQEALSVDLTVWAMRPGETEASILHGDEPLYQGTKVAFSFKTNEKAYVYLAERSASGSFDLLYPSELIATANPLPAGTTVRIPAQKWFEVDDKDLGEETVYILASPSPIKRVNTALARAEKHGTGLQSKEFLAAATEDGRCEAGAGGAGCLEKSRGLVLPSADPGVGNALSVRVASRKGDHKIFVPFRFRHVKAPQ